MIIYKWYVKLIHPKLGCMEYNARVCNHKYIQHEGEARGLYVYLYVCTCMHVLVCMYLYVCTCGYARVHALYSYSPAWGVLTGL